RLPRRLRSARALAALTVAGSIPATTLVSTQVIGSLNASWGTPGWALWTRTIRGIALSCPGWGPRHSDRSMTREGKYMSEPDGGQNPPQDPQRSEEHTSELQSRFDLVCRLLLEKKKKK